MYDDYVRIYSKARCIADVYNGSEMSDVRFSKRERVFDIVALVLSTRGRCDTRPGP